MDRLLGEQMDVAASQGRRIGPRSCSHNVLEGLAEHRASDRRLIHVWASPSRTTSCRAARLRLSNHGPRYRSQPAASCGALDLPVRPAPGRAG